MPLRDQAPVGAPCWVDLMTSDAQSSRDFYGQMFGWTAEEPAEEFGGYFSYAKDGVLVAGCMASRPDASETDAWSVYLASDDARKTVDSAEANGGQVRVPAMDVADLGTMAVVSDPGGATVGVWQPGTHGGFGVLDEPGAPRWFELHTRDYEAVVGFYRNVFRWDTEAMSDTAEFRYTTLKHGDGYLAGIMDSSGLLPEGVSAHWLIYFGVDDADAALAKIVELGGSVLVPAEDTPYGRLATAADPNGAQFRIMASSKSV